MSRLTVKWKDVEAYFKKRNYTITSAKGGEKKIIAPKTSNKPRSRDQVVIGHKCCTKKTSQVYDCYLSIIKNAFGISKKDILND